MKTIKFENKSFYIAINEVNRNKRFDCRNCKEYDNSVCSIKRCLSFKCTNKNLTATEVVITFANYTDKPITSIEKKWELIDTDGFSHECENLCKPLVSPKNICSQNWRVLPGTKIRFSLIFPELEKNQYVSSIVFRDNYPIRINIRKPSKKVALLLDANQKYEDAKSKEESDSDLYFDECLLDLGELIESNSSNE